MSIPRSQPIPRSNLIFQSFSIDVRIYPISWNVERAVRTILWMAPPPRIPCSSRCLLRAQYPHLASSDGYHGSHRPVHKYCYYRSYLVALEHCRSLLTSYVHADDLHSCGEIWRDGLDCQFNVVLYLIRIRAVPARQDRAVVDGSVCLQRGKCNGQCFGAEEGSTTHHKRDRIRGYVRCIFMRNLGVLAGDLEEGIQWLKLKESQAQL